MDARSDRIKENMRQLSDEALAKIIETDFRDYEEEALTCAKLELAARKKTGAVKTAAPSAPVANGKQEAQEAAAAAARKKKNARFWGGVWLVLAGLIIYAAVLGVATIFAGTDRGMRMAPDAPYRIIFYVLITALCLWGGIKRKPRWATFFGITLAVIGAITFSTRFALGSAAGANLQREIVGRAALATGIILVAAGAAFIVGGLLRRKSAA